MELKLIKKGFNYSQDGNGNRLVYHLQGCNMRCRWCSNPESMAPDGTIMVIGKTLPEIICPYGGIENNLLNREKCSVCTLRPCLSHSQSMGLKLSCKSYPVEELLVECEQSRPLFFDGGGVTVSGGEPTLQFEALKQLLSRLKEMGIHTAIETNGAHPKLDELFPFIDLFIIDFKHPDESVHKKHIGISNAATKETLRKAFALHPNVLVRTPLINKVNSSADDLAGFLDFHTQFDTRNASFELLKYHEYGKVKWQQCGMEYTMEDGEITEATHKMFENAYIQKGLNTIRT